MTPPVVIRGMEIVALVGGHPQGIRLSQLARAVTRRYGPSATFAAGAVVGLDLDELLMFLEARDKVLIVGGMVFPAESLHCVH